MNDYPHSDADERFPPAGTMYVFDGDRLVFHVRKEAGVNPTHVLQRTPNLNTGRYTVVCIGDRGSVFKRDYECERQLPPLTVRPVFS